MAPSFLQLTRFHKNKDNKVIPGETLLSVGGAWNIFDKPLLPPHEIMHYFSREIIKNYYLCELNLPLFSHSDEPYADYPEEVLKAAKVTYTGEVMYIHVPTKVYQFTAADLVDTTICMLNLRSKHSKIAKKLGQKTREVFPKYKNIWVSRSQFHPHILQFYCEKIRSKELNLLDEHLAQDGVNIEVLLRHAELSIKAFHSLFNHTVEIIEPDHFSFEIEPDSLLENIVLECQDYSESYKLKARQVKNRSYIPYDNDPIPELYKSIVANLHEFNQKWFEYILSENTSLFGYYI